MKQILLTSYPPVLYFFVLLRKDEPLLNTRGVAEKHRFGIDRDDGVAAGDGVSFADEIDLPVPRENCRALAGFLGNAR